MESEKEGALEKAARRIIEQLKEGGVGKDTLARMKYRVCREEGLAKVLKDHFSPYLQSGQLQWLEVDFQAPQNARLAKSYHITGPQLVLIRVENGEVVEWQPMPKVWSLLIKPEELDRYVTTGVQVYVQKLLARQSTNSTVR
ncbi:MAG: hypothetical protein ABC588_08340 [Candidatus Methanosuratincola petrocarbonis]